MDKLTIAIAISCTLVGVLGGVLIANLVNENYNRQTMEYHLENCKADGLSNCRVESIYDGLVRVGHQVIGEAGK